MYITQNISFMLRPYTKTDFPFLEKWVDSAELLLQFAGTDFSWPLTEKQLSDYQNLHPDRSFYMGTTGNQVPFAFGEIIPQENNIPRLGRIIIGDSASRGKGLGRQFVNLLLEECWSKNFKQAVDLFVWDKNTAAIKCYQAVGFIYNPEKEITLTIENQSYNIHRMTYTFPG